MLKIEGEFEKSLGQYTPIKLAPPILKRHRSSRTIRDNPSFAVSAKTSAGVQ
jgi:hypothetical protein